MRIAIHPNSGFFSDRWLDFLSKNSIQYKIVNCYNTSIINELEDCDILIWHYSQSDYKDKLIAKQILFSLQHSGKKVFPDFKTSWHFDDKLGQKYLLESLKLPTVPTFVFFEKRAAECWAKSTSFPKVFKLRSGAGSNKVRLVKNHKDASRLIRRAFSEGFPHFDRWNYVKERARKFNDGQINISSLIKAFVRLVIPPRMASFIANERGYVYFQEFIPHNQFDIRVIVIGNKAFAIKRMNRQNDFRASGSGHIIYDRNTIDINCIDLAFRANSLIKSQCIGFDMIFIDSLPHILEISYGFTVHGYDDCPGYWDNNLNWHEEWFNPQEWILENLIS